MIWLVVMGLAGWLVVQTLHLSELRSQIGTLERRLKDLMERLDTRSEPSARRGEDETASSWSPPREAANPVRAPQPIQPSVRIPQPEHVEAPTPVFVAPPPKGPPPREVIRAWLEENGLAWAGGGALALGGLFLVTYAAQRGVFTPPFRIGAAVILGALMLGASEWLKRRSDHPLAASMAAGAGAATLYGAVWASYWLYSFIGLGAAGGLLAIVSGGLLALAFRHGEPLAVLAILGGFLAPAITGPDQWTAPALTAYLSLITVTGYAVASIRRWGQAGMTSLVGASGWALAGFAAEGYVRVAALAIGPLVLASAAMERRRRRSETPTASEDRVDLFELMPMAAMVAATLLLAALSMAGSWNSPPPELLFATGGGAILFALMGAFAARRRLFPAVLLALCWLPALTFLTVFSRPFDPGLREAMSLILIAALAVAGVLAASGRGDTIARLGAGSAALVALVISMSINGPMTSAAPWAPPVIAALILLGAAYVMARSSDAPQTDLTLAFWIWAAGAAGLWSLKQGIDETYLPAATASLSLAAAALHTRLGWRGFGGVMIASATASLAALMSPDLFDVVMDNRFPWWGLALVALASVGLTYAGAWIARHNDRPRQIAEAQSTAALLIAVTGIGVLLRMAAVSPAQGGDLDMFMEASLRSLTILVAGLTSAQAVRADSSLIGRWRGQVLLCLGLCHVLAFQVIAFNPLFAWWKPAVAGPPILDSLLIGFLAPAALLGLATWKKVAINRALLAVYAAGSGLLIFLWTLMETRRLFQGASLAGGFEAVGRAEAGTYAVIGLGAVLITFLVAEQAARRSSTVSSFSGEFCRLGRWGAWGALAFALVVFGYGASPWWGPIDRPLAGLRATALLFATYTLGGGGAFLIGSAALRAGDGWLERVARMSVVFIAFALLSLVVRLAFRGFDMRPNATDSSVETWAFSAIWGLYGFGLLIWGGVRRSNDLRLAGLAVLAVTLAKIFLFDMDRLDGVIRAGSFLAVGALLLAAAVIMRRLGATAAPERSRDQVKASD